MIAALDAIARLDEGISLPGDDVIAAIFEAHCRWEQDRYAHAQDAADRAEWLSGQCGGCEEGGTGEPCDEHDESEVAA